MHVNTECVKRTICLHNNLMYTVVMLNSSVVFGAVVRFCTITTM